MVVTGATGMVGRALCAMLVAQGVPFRVLSRNPARARKLVPQAVSYHEWQPIERGALWVPVVERARALVHLASPLAANARWTPEHKQALYDSCVVGTQGLVSALAQATVPPPVLVCASTVGFYGLGSTPDGSSEEYAEPGTDFVGRLTADWEAAASHAGDFGVRQVSLRSGLVLGRAGALRRLRRAARVGFGGTPVPADQPQPWIHLEDELGLLLLAIQDEQARGPLNCVAPQAVSVAEFMAALRKQLHFPVAIRARHWMVPGAVTATLGRGASPGRALALGYDFRQPKLAGALRDLL